MISPPSEPQAPFSKKPSKSVGLPILSIFSDPLLTAVKQTATTVQGDLSALDKNADQIVKTESKFTTPQPEAPDGTAPVPPKQILAKRLADQQKILAAAELNAGDYLNAEDAYFDKNRRYVYPDLRTEVIAKIASAKSSMVIHQAMVLDGPGGKGLDTDLGDLKRPEPPPDLQARQQADNTASSIRQGAAGSGSKGGMEGSDRAAGLRGASLVDARLGGDSFASKSVAGRFQAPDKGAPSAASLLAGRPLDGAGALPESAKGAELLKQVESLFSSGKNLEALAWARKMVGEDPGNPAFRRLLAQVLSKLGRHEEAESAALEAIRLDPKDAKAYIALAWAQLHLKKYPEALNSVSMAIKLEPENASAYVLRSFVYEQLGEREKMLADLRKAATLDPDKYEELLRRAMAGERLFDPNDPQSDMLLEGLFAKRGRKVDLKTVGLGLGALCLLGVGLLGFRKRKESVAGEEAGAAEAAGPPASQKAFTEKYRIGRQLAKTERTELLEAHDTSLDRDVLVRRLCFAPDESGSRQRMRALRDIRLLADMRHPSIESVIEVAEIDQDLHVVLEQTPWATAETLMKETGRLSLAQVKPIMARACDALSAAHTRGLLHRCVTPAKILVSGQGYVRLMDFGSWGGCELAYRAPETEGGIEVPSTDVYALGATLYTLLVGHPPYEKDVLVQRSQREYKDPSACVPGLPAAVDALVRDSLSPASSARVQSVHAFRERLNQA